MGLDRELLSAYLDGEVPEPWSSRIANRIEAEPETKQAYEELLDLHQLLKRDRSELDATMLPRSEEVLSRVFESAEKGQTQTRRFSRFSLIRRGGIFSWNMSMPLPAAAAAAVVLIFSLGFGLARIQQPEVQRNPQLANISALHDDSDGITLDSGFLNPVASTASTSSGGSSYYSRSSFEGLPLTVDQLVSLQQALDQMKGSSPTALPGVTINVQDLTQLLQILQGAGKIREITIELPEQRNLELIGEPALVRPGARARSVPPNLNFSLTDDGEAGAND